MKERLLTVLLGLTIGELLRTIVFTINSPSLWLGYEAFGVFLCPVIIIYLLIRRSKKDQKGGISSGKETNETDYIRGNERVW